MLELVLCGAFDRLFSNGYNAVGELLSVAESNLPAYPTFVRNMSFTRDNLGRATNITTNYPSTRRLASHLDWPGVQQVCRIERQVTRAGKTW